MYILGINAFHGDSSAALIKDGKVIFAIEEERLRRIKHWAGFPQLAIKAALSHAGISIKQIDYITISRDPKANLAAKLRFTLRNMPSLRNIFDRLRNQSKVLSLKQLIAQAFDLSPDDIPAPVINVEHHRAHLASAFFVSPFQSAALLSIDGFGDFSSTMIGVGQENKIKVLDKVLYPNSLGVLYTAFTQWLGFHKYGDEYKVMGLAPYGEPKYLDKILGEVILVDSNGLFELNDKYFVHAKSGVTMTWEDGAPQIDNLFSKHLVEKFGPPRRKDEELTEYHRDIAASVQRTTEIVLFHILQKLYERTGIENLALAGGVAQNSVANGKMYLNTPFKNIYVPPAATDAGTAIGSALWFYHKIKDFPRKYVMTNANLGQGFTSEQIAQALRERGLKYQVLEDEPLFELIVDYLVKGGVVGWFHNRSEFGPRALGYRSILADPRNPKTRDILNLKIKRREPFRPFAPSVLEEYVDQYFEQNHPVPFMEKVFKIKHEKRSIIPAVTHVDGTGRLQTVSKETNPRYYALIETFYRRTGVPMVLNTSFNENEPIVNTPQEAIDTFLRTKMDLLVLENYVVKRPEDE